MFDPTFEDTDDERLDFLAYHVRLPREAQLPRYVTPPITMAVRSNDDARTI